MSKPIIFKHGKDKLHIRKATGADAELLLNVDPQSGGLDYSAIYKADVAARFVTEIDIANGQIIDAPAIAQYVAEMPLLEFMRLTGEILGSAVLSEGQAKNSGS